MRTFRTAFVFAFSLAACGGNVTSSGQGSPQDGHDSGAASSHPGSGSGEWTTTCVTEAPECPCGEAVCAENEWACSKLCTVEAGVGPEPIFPDGGIEEGGPQFPFEGGQDFEAGQQCIGEPQCEGGPADCFEGQWVCARIEDGGDQELDSGPQQGGPDAGLHH
jgi:hypothetical protein